MDVGTLTRCQREAIRRQLARQRDYLAKLFDRMAALSWSTRCTWLR